MLKSAGSFRIETLYMRLQSPHLLFDGRYLENETFYSQIWTKNVELKQW